MHVTHETERNHRPGATHDRKVVTTVVVKVKVAQRIDGRFHRNDSLGFANVADGKPGVPFVAEAGPKVRLVACVPERRSAGDASGVPMQEDDAWIGLMIVRVNRPVGVEAVDNLGGDPTFTDEVIAGDGPLQIVADCVQGHEFFERSSPGRILMSRATRRKRAARNVVGEGSASVTEAGLSQVDFEVDGAAAADCRLVVKPLSTGDNDVVSVGLGSEGRALAAKFEPVTFQDLSERNVPDSIGKIGETHWIGVWMATCRRSSANFWLTSSGLAASSGDKSGRDFSSLTAATGSVGG